MLLNASAEDWLGPPMAHLQAGAGGEIDEPGVAGTLLRGKLFNLGAKG